MFSELQYILSLYEAFQYNLTQWIECFLKMQNFVPDDLNFKY